MNKFKKGLASLALAALLAPVGAVAAAIPAHAVTKTQCYYTYRNTGSYPGTRVIVCYYDYAWYEEVWGNRDGWYYTPVPVYT